MKILPIEKIREADEYTIKNEPIASIELMERAATRCFHWLRNRTAKDRTIKVVAGPGNNGGDGLVIARLMSEDGYKTEVIILRFTDKESDDFTVNLKRLREMDEVLIREISEEDDIPEFDDKDVVVDAVFGSGLTRPVKGFIADVIKAVNASKCHTVAVDMPSGLFADKPSVNSGGTIVKADYTLSFQFPKLCFMYPENDQFVGHWEILPIGLHDDFISEVEVKNYFLEQEDVAPFIKKRNKFSHKGNYGHGLLVSGGYGKMGAAVLASRAALKSGAGLITTHVPRKGYDIIQTTVPENMVSIDGSEEVFSEVPDLSAYNAIAVGPGLGKEEQTQNALKLLIQNADVPTVFDADAINILAENKTWISFVPKASIFTPHPKEFERLVGKWSDEFERNEMQREFSFKYHSYVVLKGAHTAITTPGGKTFFNSSGNPGMATGGTGDVLTGILLGLLSQNYSPLEACLLGVYLHGLAGDIAAEKHSEYAMIAGGMIDHISDAYLRLLGKDI